MSGQEKNIPVKKGKKSSDRFILHDFKEIVAKLNNSVIYSN